MKISSDGNANIEANNKLPMIIITAHMNTFGIINVSLNLILSLHKNKCYFYK